ncbi:MAG TPA: carboxypeptidase regulatory-like domain-containing protein [Vicinamibacterales bacterium]|nr:carboxypeptidase regulatory-like domain-containing protein [Vicinamibacterales bacterium]
MASSTSMAIRRVTATLSVALTTMAWPAAQRSAGPAPAAPTTITATGGIRGRVLSSGGAPIRGAQVRLRDPNGRDYRLATTDEQGQFDVRDLTPGEWTVTASKAGFVSQQAGQTSPFEAATPVVLANGQRVTVDIQLMRGAAISGRITDEYGEPVARAGVRAMRARTAGGERQLVAAGIADQTDDLGAFRVYGLPPGDYYVSAALRSKSDAFQGEMQTVATYAPGTRRVADAQLIKVRMGEDQLGIDITAPLRTPGVNVSGIVFSSSGAPAPRVEVHLLADDVVVVGGGGSKGRFVMTDAAGRFTVANMPPGQYVADATLFPTINPELLEQRITPIIERGATSFEVGRSDVAGVTITIRPSATLAGSVAAEPGSVLPRQYEVAIRAQPVGGGANPSVAIAVTPGEGGKFSIPNLAGRYRFDITIRPQDWMVRRFEVDGRDVTDAVIDFSGGTTAAARIVVTDRAARLTGSVTLNGARPASVVIFPDDASKWTYPSRFVKATRTDAEGRFMFSGLPEEHYRLVALAFLEEDEFQDPDFLERMKDRSTEIRLGEAENRTVALPLSRR